MLKQELSLKEGMQIMKREIANMQMELEERMNRDMQAKFEFYDPIVESDIKFKD